MLSSRQERLLRKFKHIIEYSPKFVGKIVVGFPLERRDYIKCFNKTRDRLDSIDKAVLDIMNSMVYDLKMGDGDGRLVCRLCGRKFPTRIGFYFHLSRAHDRDIRALLVKKMKSMGIDAPYQYLEEGIII